MSVIKLSNLLPTQKAKILKIYCKGSIRQRMMDMGLVKGSEITMIRFAPLGDPMEFNLKGYHLSLRKSEADSIQVELIE
ncbi:MAG: ferrous iron transport protein A [Anaerolineaceae bacterium]|nr:ferrous iron transport protein A [Anaerolineaceae bacterium]